MKKLLIIFLAIALNGCDKNDEPRCVGVDCLPPATTTGANTFGALLDGEPFIPSGGINPLDCVYQLVNGQRSFNVQGNRRDEDFNLIRLSLSANARELEQGMTYPLVENDIGNVFARFSFNTQATFTDIQNTGTLTITRLDLNNQIISGTFSCDILDFEGNLREIREGRFDMQFTQ